MNPDRGYYMCVVLVCSHLNKASIFFWDLGLDDYLMLGHSLHRVFSVEGTVPSTTPL